MGYSIRLLHPETKEQLHTKGNHQIQGGTYCIGGTTELSLSVTYNYAPLYKRIFGEEGIRSLYGMLALDSVTLLAKGISELGDNDQIPFEDAVQQGISQLRLSRTFNRNPAGIEDAIKNVRELPFIKNKDAEELLAVVDPYNWANETEAELLRNIEDRLLPNYWNPTEYNAKQALRNLLQLAVLSVDHDLPKGGVWDGD